MKTSPVDPEIIWLEEIYLNTKKEKK